MNYKPSPLQVQIGITGNTLQIICVKASERVKLGTNLLFSGSSNPVLHGIHREDYTLVKLQSSNIAVYLLKVLQNSVTLQNTLKTSESISTQYSVKFSTDLQGLCCLCIPLFTFLKKMDF